MHKVKILEIDPVTHDVKSFTLEKSKGYKFIPGQATDVAINKPGWTDKLHSFTFTSLNEDPNLEFTIKGYSLKYYPEHKGMTEHLHQLEEGDELLIDEPWGTINYKGPGVFIAGGAGVTPFIAIFRMLKKQGKLKGNKLIFSNKEVKDIILEDEFKKIFDKDDLVLTLTREKAEGYESNHIDKAFLSKHVDDFSQNFYVCGKKDMVNKLKHTLDGLGAKADSIVFEE